MHIDLGRIQRISHSHIGRAILEIVSLCCFLGFRQVYATACGPYEAKDPRIQILEQMRSGQPDVRLAAIKALEERGDEWALARVLDLLRREKDIYVADKAVRSLGRYQGWKMNGDVVPVLLGVVNNPPARVTDDKHREPPDRADGLAEDRLYPIEFFFLDVVLNKIAALGPRALPQLRDAIRTGKLREKAACVLVLNKMAMRTFAGEEKAWESGIRSLIPDLLKTTYDKDENLRFYAVRLFGNLGSYSGQVMPRLRELADDANESALVRGAASRSIQNLKK